MTEEVRETAKVQNISVNNLRSRLRDAGIYVPQKEIDTYYLRH
jgi:hypothetical protein